MRFAFNNDGVDCVSVGFKNTQEIDEAIENLNLALAQGKITSNLT
jgi:predicted aldo/keto reductase-like oxidoreductase